MRLTPGSNPFTIIKVTVINYFVYRSSLEGASNRLVNFVLSCLQEEKVAHPSGMEEMLKDLLGNGEKLELSLYKLRQHYGGEI